MTLSPDAIASRVSDLRIDLGVPVDPVRRGPVPLNRFFLESHLRHVALPNLTLSAVADRLQRPDLIVGDDTTPLAGFVFVAGRGGLAFVSASDILPRRRFTAAHELGHFVLHRERMGGCFHSDTEQTIRETGDEEAVAMEREANRFAAELLMPEAVCRARAEEMRRIYECCPRTVLVNQLASELLVSLEAMGYRLKQLRLGDE
jgi:IrrE N-terminal-like domain